MKKLFKVFGGEKMKVISIGHFVDSPAREQIESYFKRKGKKVDIISIQFELNMTRPLRKQIETILEPFMKDDECPAIIVPGVSVASALIMAIMYKRYKKFPLIVELSRSAGNWDRWGLKEIHDLN